MIGEGTKQTRLFSKDEYIAIASRPFDMGRDVVVVMNADSVNNATRVIGTFYNQSTGNVGVTFESATSDAIRINYAILIQSVAAIPS